MPTSLTYIVLSLEAVHLGDLLRIWVRPGVKITLPRQDFQGPTAAHRTPRGSAVLYGNNVPISGPADSRESVPYKEKRTLPGATADVFLVRLRYPTGPQPAPIKSAREADLHARVRGILTPIPFRLRKGTRVTAPNQPKDRTGPEPEPTGPEPDNNPFLLERELLHWLRDRLDPCFNCCSPWEPFLHFSLQSSRFGLFGYLPPRILHPGGSTRGFAALGFKGSPGGPFLLVGAFIQARQRNAGCPKVRVLRAPKAPRAIPFSGGKLIPAR